MKLSNNWSWIRVIKKLWRHTPSISHAWPDKLIEANSPKTQITDFCGMGLMTKQFMSRLVYDHSRSVRQVDFMASWGANIDCSSWASCEATSAFAGLQILIGNVHLTYRIHESWICAALDTPKGVRMLYNMHLWEKGTRAPAPQGSAATALAARLLSLPGTVSQCGWYPHQTCLKGAVLAFVWMVKGGQKWTHFLLGCSWDEWHWLRIHVLVNTSQTQWPDKED